MQWINYLEVKLGTCRRKLRVLEFKWCSTIRANLSANQDSLIISASVVDPLVLKLLFENVFAHDIALNVPSNTAGLGVLRGERGCRWKSDASKTWSDNRCRTRCRLLRDLSLTFLKEPLDTHDDIGLRDICWYRDRNISSPLRQ